MKGIMKMLYSGAQMLPLGEYEERSEIRLLMFEHLYLTIKIDKFKKNDEWCVGLRVELTENIKCENYEAKSISNIFYLETKPPTFETINDVFSVTVNLDNKRIVYYGLKQLFNDFLTFEILKYIRAFSMQVKIALGNRSFNQQDKVDLNYVVINQMEKISKFESRYNNSMDIITNSLEIAISDYLNKRLFKRLQSKALKNSSF